MFRLIFLLFHLVLHGCWSSRPPPNKLIAVKTNCTRDLFNIKLDLDKSFKGVIFAKDFLDECHKRGKKKTLLQIYFPTLTLLYINILL